MKIRQEILERINNPVTRTKIAMALGQGEQSVVVLVRNNAPNGSLTKAAALKVIREETGLGYDEILEDERTMVGEDKANN